VIVRWIALTALGALAVQSAQSDQRPTFRTVSDLVPVPVAVRNGKEFVSGLTATDFELYDNGVRQSIGAVSTTTLGLDVTLVVDTSGSVVGSLDRFRSDVKEIAGMLRPDDQVRLVTFDTNVRAAVPMQQASRRLPVDRITTGDMTSLVDALLFALARAGRPDRRHLVFVFSDGYDNVSVMGYGAIPELAARTDAILHIALVRVSGAPDEWPNPAFDALAAAAKRTGGALSPPSESTRGVVPAFKSALETHRHSYTLYYTPTGVPRGGWHDIVVKVPKSGRYDVQWRQGYSAEKQ
jgi:VWFA-related protein